MKRKKKKPSPRTVDKTKIEKAVRTILEAIGEDASRTGLIETPARVAELYEQFFSSVYGCCGEILTDFMPEKSANGLILLKGLPIYSLCEHHLMPFFGKCHVAYIPSKNKVPGIGKILKLVRFYSGKLQIQERLTKQLSDAIAESFSPKGVFVMIEAEHLCMSMKNGYGSKGKMTTLSSKGTLNDPVEKNNVLSMIKTDSHEDI